MLFELIIYVCAIELGKVACLSAKPYQGQATSLVICSARLDEQTAKLFVNNPSWQNLVIVQYSITCNPVNLDGLDRVKPPLEATLPEND